MVEWFIAGGAFMWPLLAVAVFGLIVVFYKIFTLMGTGLNAEKLMIDVKKAIQTQGVPGALKLVQGNNKPVALVVNAGLTNAKYGMDNVEKGLINMGGIQNTYLYSGMVWLSTVVALAPMIGFLGTVWGMIAAMDAIAAANDISPAIVADGISQALITTAAGLIIAVTIQTFQNFFQSVIEKRVLEMEESSVALVEVMMDSEYKDK
ncbi:MAG TPA: MotA/TolQ/ExbB proton channel family protein [Clostridiales bacterium]|jgi:biopolymer transport protein ExbB|nr:MotA/TolQ/ExbB proton channel family protein [Clostridiales bacterium]HQP70164.1 MotA/TolQ/ExbB proton channel family protein [Clostridiales bacterium]